MTTQDECQILQDAQGKTHDIMYSGMQSLQTQHVQQNIAYYYNNRNYSSPAISHMNDAVENTAVSQQQTQGFPPPPPRSQRPMPDPNPNLYVHNVPKDATETELTNVFCPYGTIERVRLKVNQKVGPNAVYAFVTFSSTEEARVALKELQGFEIRGRRLRVEFQKSNPYRGDENKKSQGRSQKQDNDTKQNAPKDRQSYQQGSLFHGEDVNRNDRRKDSSNKRYYENDSTKVASNKGNIRSEITVDENVDQIPPPPPPSEGAISLCDLIYEVKPYIFDWDNNESLAVSSSQAQMAMPSNMHMTLSAEEEFDLRLSNEIIGAIREVEKEPTLPDNEPDYDYMDANRWPDEYVEPASTSFPKTYEITVPTGNEGYIYNVKSVCWRGILERNGKKGLDIEILLVDGIVEPFLRKPDGEMTEVLNICHRSSLNEIYRRALRGMCLIRDSSMNDHNYQGQLKIDDYIAYFMKKNRAGVITCGDRVLLYVLPFSNNLYQQFARHIKTELPLNRMLLGLFGESQYPVAAPRMDERKPPAEHIVVPRNIEQPESKTDTSNPPDQSTNLTHPFDHPQMWTEKDSSNSKPDCLSMKSNSSFRYYNKREPSPLASKSINPPASQSYSRSTNLKYNPYSSYQVSTSQPYMQPHSTSSQSYNQSTSQTYSSINGQSYTSNQHYTQPYLQSNSQPSIQNKAPTYNNSESNMYSQQTYQSQHPNAQSYLQSIAQSYTHSNHQAYGHSVSQPYHQSGSQLNSQSLSHPYSQSYQQPSSQSYQQPSSHSYQQPSSHSYQQYSSKSYFPSVASFNSQSYHSPQTSQHQSYSPPLCQSYSLPPHKESDVSPTMHQQPTAEQDPADEFLLAHSLVSSDATELTTNPQEPVGQPLSTTAASMSVNDLSCQHVVESEEQAVQFDSNLTQNNECPSEENDCLTYAPPSMDKDESSGFSTTENSECSIPYMPQTNPASSSPSRPRNPMQNAIPQLLPRLPMPILPMRTNPHMLNYRFMARPSESVPEYRFNDQ